MENIINDNSNETLLLTKEVFNGLLNSIIQHFKKTHNLPEKYKDSQLYGFGNYNSEKPSLKNDLEELLKGYVNGKYLYNKYREAASGKPIIKISGEYKILFFNYLGFKNVTQFIKNDWLTPKQRSTQLELLNQDTKIDDYYYVCYYFGEDNKMYKGQVIVYNGWKTIEMIYVYSNENEKNGAYTFFGTITLSENFIYIDTKYYVGNKKSEGAKLIFFVGKSAAYERNFLIGTYSGFDKYDRAVSGKMILKKYNSKNEMEDEVKNKTFDPIICQELNKNRLVVESSIRKNPMMFSSKSPYAQVLLKIHGNFIFDFRFEENNYKLNLKIEKYHFNIESLNDSIVIEEDKITILNKGQIINFNFSISGMFQLQRVSIYIKVLDFTNNKTGQFNGVDINNNVVSGNVHITAVP